MKRILTLIILFLTTITLSACSPYDIPKEDSIDLTELAYSEYLDDSNPVISIKVEGMGTMKLQLFPEVAPNTVDNFIAYIERNDYKDNEFHRVMVGFMIQGGKLDNPACTIQGEMNNNPAYSGSNDLSHYRGVISMARRGGDYDSASSQFFINHYTNSFLDNEYAPFGGLVSGFNILDYIAEMNNGSDEIPYEPVYIRNITVNLNGYEPNTPICE